MNEWVWSNGGMVLTGENWSTGRKTLYSVGGRWMDEYGAMVEWYWQGRTEVFGEKHTAWVLCPSAICQKQILSHCPVNKPRPPHIKSARNTACKTITFHRNSPLNTAVLTEVMKGITSHLFKWMFKHCLMYTHRRFYVTHPTLSTATKHPFNDAEQ